MPTNSASPVAVSDPDAAARANRNTTKSPAATESAFVNVTGVSTRYPAVAGAVPVAVFADAKSWASTSWASPAVVAETRTSQTTPPDVADAAFHCTFATGAEA